METSLAWKAARVREERAAEGRAGAVATALATAIPPGAWLKVLLRNPHSFWA